MNSPSHWEGHRDSDGEGCDSDLASRQCNINAPALPARSSRPSQGEGEETNARFVSGILFSRRCLTTGESLKPLRGESQRGSLPTALLLSSCDSSVYSVYSVVDCRYRFFDFGCQRPICRTRASASASRRLDSRSCGRPKLSSSRARPSSSMSRFTRRPWSSKIHASVRW